MYDIIGYLDMSYMIG